MFIVLNSELNEITHMSTESNTNDTINNDVADAPKVNKHMMLGFAGIASMLYVVGDAAVAAYNAVAETV